ncbi:MAG: hypothetical protein HY727_09255 [Candidatus Rokubacteria bacterium]|nr:hypothetical protein [Candidatus Rokubacteria bacterium]
MERILVIGEDQRAMEELGLALLDRGVGVVMADNVCEGVRALLATPVSLVVVDAALLRLTAREQAVLFEQVAPGVEVAVVVRETTSLAQRVALELVGFRVLTGPAVVEDLLEKNVSAGVR